MSKSIKLSPNHGLNPTIPVCCWCGKPKNEIALMGRVYEKNKDGKAIPSTDVEMPMYTVMDYEPCDECETKWNDSGATIIIEVSHTRTAAYQPPIQHDSDGSPLYPTGNLVGIAPEKANEIMPGANLKAGSRALMEDIAFQRLFAAAIAGEPDVDAEENLKNNSQS